MIYTFYSFKGGVGRSMAMANVAWELAQRGLRVLAIDFDLEAPGLERYFSVPVAQVHGSAGVIDLIQSFKRSLSGGDSMADDAEFRQLDRFVYRPVAEFAGRGRLDLMPAGRRASEDDKRAYALAVRTFDWQDFYFNWEGQAFFEWLRKTLVESAADGAAAPYDVVLADSRTGVTEMGGVCACQLADVVVMLSAPNHQNVEGTRELAADLRSEPVQRLRRDRPPLEIVVVPARVEQRLPELRAKFEARFQEAFSSYLPAAHQALGLRTHDLALPYVPEFAFEEQVAHARSNAAAELDAQYRRLADALLVLHGPGASTVLKERADAVRAQWAPPSAASPSAASADDSAAAAAAALPASEDLATLIGAAASLTAGTSFGSAAAETSTAPAYDPSKRSAGVDLYLSCASSSTELVSSLLAALDQAGHRLSHEFGRAEAYGAERELPPTAHEQLRHAQHLVLCADERGLRPWQRAELLAARGLPKPPAIVQLLLPGAPPDAFALAFGDTLRDCPLIDLSRWPQERAGLWLLAQALRSSAQGESPLDSAAPSAADTWQNDSPFPGDVAYAEQHSAVFMGRQLEIAALHRQVRATRRSVLRGPVGAGKTSLVRAGLMPLLRSSGVEAFGEPVYADVRAQGHSPIESQLQWAAQQRQRPAADLVLLDHVDEAGPELLAQLAQWWAASDGPRLLWVLRPAWLHDAALAAVAEGSHRGAQAAGLPKDPLHRTVALSPECERLNHALAAVPALELQPQSVPALRETVDAVLAKVGRRAEAGLLERLFSDAGGIAPVKLDDSGSDQPAAAVAPALGPTPVAASTVQRALALLWTEQTRGWLTNDAYQRAGGVDGLYTRALDQALLACSGTPRRAMEGLLLRSLIRAGDGSIVSQALSWARSGTPALAAVAQRLLAAGLWSLRPRGADWELMPAHRPQQWPALDPLAAAHAPWLARMHLIDTAYPRWLDTGEDGSSEGLFLQWNLATFDPPLAPAEHAYVQLRQQKVRRRQGVQRSVWALVVLVLVVGSTAAWFAQRAARNEALQATQAARDEALQAARAQRSQAVQGAPVVLPSTWSPVIAVGAGASSVAGAGAGAATGAVAGGGGIGSGSGVPGVGGVRPPLGDPSKLPERQPPKVQVVVHRTGKGLADFEAARTLLAVLPSARYELLGNIEPVDQTVCGDVRVFHGSDLDAASTALAVLNQALKASGDLRQLALNDRRNEGSTQQVRPGRLEVWLPPLSNAPIQRQDRWGESRLVAGGCAVVGSDAKDRDSLRRGLGAADVAWFASELPAQRVFVPAFYIGRTEVTAAAFLTYQRACEAERGAACAPWKPRYLDPQREGQRPATFVSWAQANAYCRWAGGELPSDLQWEKAARGIDGRFWPWGDEPQTERFQGKSQQPRRPVAVGSLAQGHSPYGVADMAGNVWEFTRDLWSSDGSHSIRGGSYLNTLMESRTSVRWSSGLENEGAEYLGFRCVVELPP